MLDPNTMPSLMSDWSIKVTTPPYWVMCVTIAIMVRVVNCFFKALDAGAGDQKDRDLANLSFIKRFRLAIDGFDKDKLTDHWLGFIIGLAEISFYPVLICTNNLSVIGGWLAIKTAGGWKLWYDNPRAFNRFLITNLLNLAIAYFLMVKWIQ